ncbi:PAS-domain containing protein [Shewanella sp. JM162201]|uniref:histidine kinase n=1 Tax=Shewanella jiangmenensis TaxID=2837387 RepID=A0ABS5V0E7_9GAMM|nr:PAS-domain containing protein [Shewanella jiangmenensis]MBT1443939.1 PAS-domain containing protein [Shewanella jiangmenensis]
MLAWLSVDTWWISAISIAYLALLFIVAQWGQNQARGQWHKRPWVYSLSLGVCCTSWAFYGTVGQAASTGAWLAPIYIGSILCLVLAWPMLMRTLQIIKSQNLTSVADFIACRFDRSPQIAASVALVSLFGTIPYIALQLRAISTSFDLLTGTFQSGISTAFIVTIVLIIFSILFGTRQLAASKQNQGLVLAIAFSSLVKLLALTAVGIFATFFVFDGFSELLAQSAPLSEAPPPSSGYFLVSQILLGAITIYALPQEFHMMMIENHHAKELKTARWMVPVYLLLMNLFVLPIALAGQLSFPGGSVDADTYVLTLPLFYQQAWLGIVVYVGGLAAATAMVIVAAIVLSTMISTEILTPLLLRLPRFSSHKTPELAGILLNLRRIAIATILLSAFAFERYIDQQNHLAGIGLLSFVLLSQFAPAAVGALYWRRANRQGAFYGLLLGSLVWLYTLLLPATFPDAAWVQQGPASIHWLRPGALFGLEGLDNISHGLFYSLLANIGCFVLLSLLREQSIGERLQADVFINRRAVQPERHLSIDDLASLLHRFINKEEAAELLARAKAAGPELSAQQREDLVVYTRLKLSGVLGSASTRMVMNAAARSRQVPLEDVVSIVDEASQLFEFNRELLQSGVENIEQGISVVDADMRLVAWNKRYIELLGYPRDLVKAGIPIEKLLRYNIERGIIVGDEAQELVEKRLDHMRSGSPHHFRRTMLDGRVLEIRGQAMPGGGFVSTFTDISAHIEAEKALQSANETLEKRVAERTAELMRAKAEAEAANSSKTRFLAAASHDLMQPFNALTLFTEMLKQKATSTELQGLAGNIEASLTVVESLLSDLVEISRLDSRSLKTESSEFALDELLSTLVNEFNALAPAQGINFSYRYTSCMVKSDQRLLRRIVQNFLSNAFHYSPAGALSRRQQTRRLANGPEPVCDRFTPRVVLGARRLPHSLLIQVWDNGPGIPADKQQSIFGEFERLEQTREIPGLGLGLAICDRIASLLGIRLAVHSELGKGTCFSVEVPRVSGRDARSAKPVRDAEPGAEHFPIRVLVIDNDELMLKAISGLLEEWGCEVLCAKGSADALRHYTAQARPRLIIADYHLDDDDNGVSLVQSLLETDAKQPNTGARAPACIICSADPSEAVREHTSSAGFSFVRKPVKAIALKRLIKQLS